MQKNVLSPGCKTQCLENEETLELADNENDAELACVGKLDSQPVYQSRFELLVFVFCTALSQAVATIAVPICFPALTLLADFFDTSLDMINLTSTMYLVFMGVSPLLWATLSDKVGRRPIYLSCCVCFIGANVGLALAKSYWTLFGLRGLQAFGGASLLPLTGAVIGDVTTRENRGRVMGLATGLGLLGNCLGPLIGGVLISRWGWQGIFWFLTALGGFILILMLTLFPETHKGFAGNGSLMPKPWVNRSPYAYFRHLATGIPYLPHQLEYNMQWCASQKKISVLHWLTLLRRPNVILVLVPAAIHHATWFMLLTAQSTTLATDYHMDTTNIGYTYLSSGTGTLAGSLIAGHSLHWSFKHHVEKRKQLYEKHDISYRHSNVDIYSARLNLCFYASLLLIVFAIVFGWTLQLKVSFYCPVVMTFFVSGGSTFFLSASTTVLVDNHPHDSGAAVACLNLCRGLISAAGLAAVHRMTKIMGPGGMSTVMAALCGLSLLCLVYLIRYSQSPAHKRENEDAMT